MENNWKYYIVLNDSKYDLNNIVEYKESPGDGLPLCLDISVAMNFDSPEQLIAWVKENTSLSIENGDFHIEGHYLKEEF